jgi:hypothetical protein
MRWVLFFAVFLVSVAAFGGGLFAGKRAREQERPGLAYATVGVGLAFLLARGVFRAFPLFEFALFPFDAYAVLRPWWAVPAGMLVLGVGATQMSTAGARRGVAVFGALVLAVCVQRLWVTARFDPATLSGELNAQGVCFQSTDYSCGAAAAVMLLNQHGVQATEREMAERCWTNGLTGTDEFCVARGLRQKLSGSGKAPVLRTLSFEELVAEPGPWATTIDWGILVDHWVLVREVEGGFVHVLDPILGVRPMTKDEFLAVWTGTALGVEAVR